MQPGRVSEALTDAAAHEGCPGWLVLRLLSLERSQVGRFGAGGVNVKAGEVIERAAAGEAPSPADLEHAVHAPAGMRLTAVRVHGFRQFADAELRLAHHPGRPVTVIEGSNGYGKSQLVAALRFALRSQSKADVSMLHAHATGDKASLAVEVGLEHSDQGPVVVRRGAGFRRRADGGYERRGSGSLTVQIGQTEPLQDQHAEDWLASQIPPEVLDYFVFDAESPVVEALSGQAGEKLPDVRGQVEAAIGVAPLRRAGVRCRDVAKDRRRQLEALETRPTAAVEDELARAREGREVLFGRFQALDAECAAAEAEAEQLAETLRGPASAEATVDWGALEAERDQLRAALDSAEAQARRALVSDLPLALVGVALERALSGAIDPRSLTEARAAFERVADAVVAGRIPWATGRDREAVLADLLRAAELPEEAERLAELHRRADRARRRLPTVAERGTLTDAPPRLAALEARLSERPAVNHDLARAAREAAAAHDEARVRAQNLREQLGALGRQVEEADAEVEALAAELSDARSEEQRRTRLTAVAKTATAAARALEAACGALVEERLGAFESAATRTLRSLVHKSDLYDRIEVDRATLRYRIVDERGAPVPSGRSVGERTVLALALVGGLRRASGYRFPLFVEAPLKTLDPRHHDHVVHEFLSRYEGQTVLLVKPGELDTASDKLLRSRLGQLFRIERAGDGRELSWLTPVELLELSP